MQDRRTTTNRNWTNKDVKIIPIHNNDDIKDEDDKDEEDVAIDPARDDLHDG